MFAILHILILFLILFYNKSLKKSFFTEIGFNLLYLLLL